MISQLQVLGLSSNASLEDIKKQYRTLSKKYHPDLNQESDSIKFINITVAYSWLLKNYQPASKHEANDIKDFFTRSCKFNKVDNKYELNVPLQVKKIVNKTRVSISESMTNVSIHRELIVDLTPGVSLPATYYLTQDGKDYKVTFSPRDSN